MFKILQRIFRIPLKATDAYLDLWRREYGIGGGILASIAISLVFSAISFGIAALLAPKPRPVTGPRLDDLGAPIINPGRAIPKATGRNITPAQIIWTGGLVETKHVEKVKGGKGGGKSTKVTTFTYSISLALAFNDGEICGVQRVIANGSKVIWSARIGSAISLSEIDRRVQEKYDEVFPVQQAFWAAIINERDGGLKYTSDQVDSLADADADNASSKLRNELESVNLDIQPRYAQVEFFNGTETQDPSSIIEAKEGVGNVSAFRGTAYLVFEDLELADFGNFPPSITVDYATVGDQTTLKSITTGADGTQALFDHWYLIDYRARKIFNMVGGNGYGVRAEMIEYDLDTLDQVDVHDLSTNPTTLGGAQFFGIDEWTGYLIGAEEVGGTPFLYGSYTYDPVTKTWPMFATTETYLESASDFTVQQFPVIYSADKSIGAFLSTDAVSDVTQRNSIMNIATGAFIGRSEGPEPTLVDVSADAKWFISKFNSRNGENTAWGMWVSWENIRPVSYTLNNDGTITTVTYNDIPRTTFRPAAGVTDYFHKSSIIQTVPIVGSDGSIFYMISMGEQAPAPVRNGGHIYFKWSPTTDSVIWFTDSLDGGPEINLANGAFNETTAINYRLDGNRIIFENAGLFATFPDSDFFQLDLATGAFAPVTDLDAFDYGTDINFESAIWDDIEGVFLAIIPAPTGYTFDPYQKWTFGRICFDDPVSIGAVIRNFMARAGYDSTEYEIAAGLDAATIWGFNDNTGRSTRELLQDLAQIRPMIVNEIEGKLRFRLVDQTNVATIPKADVRAYDGQSEPPAWIAEVVTLEDLALPKSLHITYQDIDRGLNPTTSIFTREITESNTIVEFAVQAVDSAEAMRNSVLNGISVLMSSKRTFKVSVPLKYVVLEPGDVITIPISETRTAKVRISQATLGANNIVELECALFIDTSLGIVHTDQFTRFDTDTAVGATITDLHLLDIPYLTDEAEKNAAGEEDDGIYIAMSSRDTGWPGANLYVDRLTTTTEEAFGVVSQASGAPDWELVANTSIPVAIGALVLLPDGQASALVQDVASEMVISFQTPGADFITISDAVAISTQDNVFLVGAELIQAQTVSLLNTVDGLRTYQFTDLWRGLQGTEWAIGTLAAGDTAVHMDPAGLQRVDLENDALIGLGVGFRAVTMGSDLTAVATTILTYDAASRKPWAPSIEDIIRDEIGNLTFTLMQRNRYGSLWTPAAFESDPQDFEIDILAIGGGSPDVVRTIVLTDTTAVSYTAAQQTTDFGSPLVASVTIKAFQLNSAGRRGFAREETL